MLTHKWFTDEEAQEIANCFIDFFEHSNFEYIMNRWQYDDEDFDLDQFFDEFVKVSRIDEFFTESATMIKSDKRVSDTRHQWYLYKLRKEMFIWDNFGRGVNDLFIWGSVEFGGYRKDWEPRAQAFKRIIIPNSSDQVVYYSTLMFYCSMISEGMATSNPLLYKSAMESRNVAGIENMENHDKFLKKFGLPDFATKWLEGRLDGDVMVFHNKTAKEIILWVFTNSDWL